MKKIKNIFDRYFWILPILLAIPVCFSLLKTGFFGASDDLHIAWLYEMEQAIRVGQFPPRFVPDLSFGFGYPLFNFVFPLPFYFGEIFRLIGLSFVASVKGVFFASFILSSLTMYFFLKNFLKRPMALAGSMIYVYAPYRSTEVYVRGAFGEALSFVFFPLIALAILKIYDATKYGKNSWGWVGAGALALGGLVLSHDIAGYMFAPFAFLLVVLLFLTIKNKLRFALSSFFMFAIGLLSSIYFWLPALRDSSLMKYDTVYDFVNYFPTLKRLLTPYFGYGGFPTMSFFIGFAPILAIIVGFVFFVFRYKKFDSKERTIIVWSSIILFLSMFMMNYRSVWVWNHIPLIPYFQFPWRFLMMVIFAAPIFLITVKFPKMNAWPSLILSVFAIVTTISYFRPQDFFPNRGDAYYLNRYVPYPTASEEYLKTSEEYLRLGKNTVLRPGEVPSPIEFNGGKVLNFESYGHGLRASILIKSDTGGVLTYNKYNFPGWKATIDDKRVPIGYGLPYGQITVNIPPGEHKVIIWFGETTLNIFLNAVSIISIASAGFLILKRYKKNP